MSSRPEALLGLLADGSLHSGAALAAEMQVSRAAIWKMVGELRDLGVDVESLPRRGYRLPRGVELLDEQKIRAAARQQGTTLPADLEVLFETDSTNVHLNDAAPPAPGRPRVVFAELQRAGRGRRGRSWLAPFGSGLAFSVAWTFAETPADLPALGLAVGVSVTEALHRLGFVEVRVKWPNDIVWRNRKLGGLLLQMRSEIGGGASVVAGLGLNIALPAAARSALEGPGLLPATDLCEIDPGRVPERNTLAARWPWRCLQRWPSSRTRDSQPSLHGGLASMRWPVAESGSVMAPRASKARRWASKRTARCALPSRTASSASTPAT